jgi:hypothetical protein
MKVKDLTLGQIIEIADKYKGNCSKCPLGNASFHCHNHCMISKEKERKIKESLEEEIDYPYMYLSIEMYNKIQGLIDTQTKVIEILKRFITVYQEVDFDTFLTSNYSDDDIKLVQEMIFGECTKS